MKRGYSSPKKTLVPLSVLRCRRCGNHGIANTASRAGYPTHGVLTDSWERKWVRLETNSMPMAYLGSAQVECRQGLVDSSRPTKNIGKSVSSQSSRVWRRHGLAVQGDILRLALGALDQFGHPGAQRPTSSLSASSTRFRWFVLSVASGCVPMNRWFDMARI